MILLPPELLEFDRVKLEALEADTRAIYRRILFSRAYSDDDLIGHYFASTQDLRDLLSIKNAQMEAQTEEEARDYLVHLKSSLGFIMDEIMHQRNFRRAVDLLHLLRIISPEAHAKHPNRFRGTLVQVGSHVCPPSEEIQGLIETFFDCLNRIRNPILRAIYAHHELVRIHPFSDGNGRVSRMAKNWILMYDLYPPVFINDAAEKQAYVASLGASFGALASRPNEFSGATRIFFEQEFERLRRSIQIVGQGVIQAIEGGVPAAARGLRQPGEAPGA
ncbi:MAG: Fic family protein [Spirochaetes bacterium]|nr:Fic family protein [Spirochaetota bacterium]